MSLSANPRVLLVDDDDLIRDLYRRVLGRTFTLHTAGSGMEALELVQSEEPFAVIMTDMQMPGMNGIELLRRIRTLSPVTSRILLSGLAGTPELDTDRDLASILNKPCAHQEVIAALKREVEAYEFRKGQPDPDTI